MLSPHQDTRLDFHGAVERALRAWRRGAMLVQGCSRAVTRGSYDQAMGAIEPTLRRHGSVAELVDAYYGGDGDFRARVEAACAAAPEGDFLVRALVEDAAYWRRLQELIAQTAAAS